MKKILLIGLAVILSFSAQSQLLAGGPKEPANDDLAKEVSKLKDLVKQLQDNEQQSDKARYQKNYQLIVNGLETIKDMFQGAMEITGARSQNILYKKLIDINNPTSDVLGFQLQDVMQKSLDDNLTSLINMAENEKKRLKGQVSGIFEGLKRTFAPLNLITSVLSSISSFSTYKARIEKMGKRADSIIVDAINPITQEVLSKIGGQMQPYILFYNELNRVNGIFENALYQHEVEYRDFIEEMKLLKESIEKKIDLGESVSSQVNLMFDLTNSSAQDFNYKSKLSDTTIQELLGQCVNVFDMVDRFKKFTNDFITIEDDFYRNNLDILNQKARALPVKDGSKIDQIISDLGLLKNGNPATNTPGFDASYKLRLKGILSKLYAVNKLRV